MHSYFECWGKHPQLCWVIQSIQTHLQADLWLRSTCRAASRALWSWEGSQRWCRRCWLEIWWEEVSNVEYAHRDHRHLSGVEIQGCRGWIGSWRWSRSRVRRRWSRRWSWCRHPSSCTPAWTVPLKKYMINFRDIQRFSSIIPGGLSRNTPAWTVAGMASNKEIKTTPIVIPM